MSYLGSFDIDDYVGIPAATHRFSSGAAYAPSAITYSIYEEATNVGIDEDVDMTPASPFDGIVGCYWVRRQLTTAAGFERGKNYLVVIKATVDSVAAIQMHTFQVGAKVNAALIGGTAQTGRDLGSSVLLSSGTGAGQISLASGAVTVGTNNDKTGYTASTVSDKTGYSLATDQEVNVTKWGGTAVASAYVQANTAQFAGQTITCAGGVTIPAATLASTTNITGGTITTVTTLTNLPAVTADWLTAAGVKADAVTKIQAGLSTLDAAGVRTAVGMATANLDTQLSGISDNTLSSLGVIQIKRGLPCIYRFTASAVNTVTLVGPDQEITKTAPTLVQSGSSRRYTCTFTPDDKGEWTLTTEDGSGVITHEAHFNCVDATDAEHALGLQNGRRSYVTSWPVNTIISGQHLFNNGGTAVRCYCSQGKHVIPVDGHVWGVTVFLAASSLPGNTTTVKFFTVDPTTTLARGISNDFHGFSWTPNAWNTVTFSKPVPCRAGDWYGLEVNDTAGSGNTYTFVYQHTGDSTYGTDKIQKLRKLNTALSLSAANDFAAWDTPEVTGALLLKLLLSPPSIVIAGHSFWASHPNSHTVYEDSHIAYSRANDLGAMLGELLGVPVINCADGGTNLADWIGATGLFETVVKPLCPAVMIYDSVYNDYTLTNATFLSYLDRLLQHCDQAGVELCLMEGVSGIYANTEGFADDIERLNAVSALWALHHGVSYVPLYYRIGQHSGGSEHASLRRVQKNTVTGLSDYDEGGATREHLSQAGLLAVARALADNFKNRRYGGPHWMVNADAAMTALTLTDSPLQTISERDGFNLASTGLDVVDATQPSAVATTFRDMVVMTYHRFYGKVEYEQLTSTTGVIRVYNGGSVVSTQDTTVLGTVQTQGATS